MSSAVGLAAGAVFVCLALFNVATMFESSRRGRDAAIRDRYLAAHRIGGYLFVMLFCVLCYLMLSRVWGTAGELPNFVIAHIVLALALIPLIVTKIAIARRYQDRFQYLMPLGLAIFGVACTLVLLPALLELISSAKPGRVGSAITLLVMVMVCLWAAALAFAPRKGAAISANMVAGSSGVSEAVSKSSSTARNFMTLVLAKIEQQTHDTRTLRFLVPRERTFRAKPGQFMTFHWQVDGTRVLRSYTISSSPAQAGYIEITPKRIPQGLVSTFLNERITPGYAVEATGPHGKFYFDESRDKRIVLIAAGSGITPMISIVRYIADHHLSTPVTLLYFVRTRRDIIFEKELEAIAAQSPTFRLAVSLSQPDENWVGHGGRLSREFLVEQVPDLATPTYFLCGPRGFMENARTLLTSLGVVESRIREESFGEGKHDSGPHPSESPIVGEAEFARSRKVAPITEGSTLLQVAELNGVKIPYGCRQGQCGTCTTRLLKGTVSDYGDTVLAKQSLAAGCVLACVARPRGAVTLDA